ncbi:MAG: SdpI family protein [Maricaulaceae bacterium]
MIRIGLLATVLGAAIAGGLGAVGFFGVAPDAEIPLRYGLDGSVSRYGGRWEAFMLLPAVIAGVGLMLAILPKIDPRGRNLARSGPFYLTSWIGVTAVLAAAQGFVTGQALGWFAPPALGETGWDGLTLILVATMALTAALGNVMTKARPNFFAGVRTPWTLSSDLSWDKTHRFVGRAWLAVSVAGVLGCFVAPTGLVVYAYVSLLLGASAAGVVYSFVVWRDDPNRETLAPDDAGDAAG